LALLFSAIAGVFFINIALANFFPIHDWKMVGVIPVPESTKLPVVTIFNPQNETSYSSGNLLLNFSVTTETSNNISLSVDELYYIASWQKERTDINTRPVFLNNRYSPRSVFSINLTNVPEGPRRLEVVAVAHALAYVTDQEGNESSLYMLTKYVAYQAGSSSTVKFTIDTTIPKILSLSLENKTYDTSNVPFTLATNEPISQVSYSLDEQANVTVTGNATLTDLSNGIHNITVYAWDNAGNVGSSETVTFTVAEPEPFPIILVIASIAPIATVSASILVYLKRRKGEAKPS
jgi:hypothetical protein